MELPKSAAIGLEWEQSGDAFQSPDIGSDQELEQYLMFARPVQDGKIEADITPLEGTEGFDGRLKKEAGVVFRASSGLERGYYAGIGGWSGKFFLARIQPGDWQILATNGRSSSLQYGHTYKLSVEFVGSHITVYENSVPVLYANDQTYRTGQWALRTRKTKATFASVSVQGSKPRCFVVMPFASELSFIYGLIKRITEDAGFVCVRADEIFVSRPAIDEIRDQIAKADLVIVDFTGRNTNVYYEAGLADAWKKSWIVLSQSVSDLTFDVQHIRTIIYSDRMGADQRFCEELTSAVKSVMSPS